MRARWVEEVESFNLERKERSMATIRVHDGDGKGRARRRLTQVASLGLGLAMFGTVGLSGTLAQENGMAAGGDAESIVNSIIQQVFAEIFGGGVDDNAGVSGGGNIEVGGNSGSNVMMGGSGGGVSIGGGSGGSGGGTMMGGSGGSGGGAMMGDDSAVYP
jgi:hypothetical protein